METLALQSLKSAYQSLSNAIGDLHSLSQNPSITEQNLLTIKAGVIQNFEMTYELCWKMMKRWLEINVSAIEVDGVSRRELYRVAAENKLISEVEVWMDFHKARNLTSHTYNELLALEVVKLAESFLLPAQKLIEQLEAKND